MSVDKDKDKDKDKLVPTAVEEDVNISELVKELEVKFPNVERSVIFEATSCIHDENFLINHLSNLEKAAVAPTSTYGIGDLFKAGDTQELSAIIDIGVRAKTSKAMILAGATVVGIAKIFYHTLTDDDIKAKFVEIDKLHAKKLIEDATKLTESLVENNNNNKNKEAKWKKMDLT